MSWGKSIVVVFILFASFIGVLVSICLREDISLVAVDYYDQELKYQHQIDRVHNTEDLEVKPVIQLVGKFVEVQFLRFADVKDGSLELFRPSDERFDRHFKLENSSGVTQQFDVRNLPAGMYKARMRWSMNGKEYYQESVIYL